MKKLGQHLLHKIHRLTAHAHNPLHCLYFAFVACEAHGYYGLIAGALFLVSVPEIFERGA